MSAFDAQVQAAISAHGQWKVRLRMAIETGASEFEVESIRRDDQCAFGNWLYGEARAAHGKDPEYAKVRALHAEFHGEAARVLASAVSGRRTEAEAAMAIGGAFSKTSAALVSLLKTWRAAAA